MIARGNEGVASRIKISEGSIGYVEFGFARRLGLTVAPLENKEGRFVAPSPEAGAAAISASAGLDLDGLAASIVNPQAQRPIRLSPTAGFCFTDVIRPNRRAP